MRNPPIERIPVMSMKIVAEDNPPSMNVHEMESLMAIEKAFVTI